MELHLEGDGGEEVVGHLVLPRHEARDANSGHAVRQRLRGRGPKLGHHPLPPRRRARVRKSQLQRNLLHMVNTGRSRT